MADMSRKGTNVSTSGKRRSNRAGSLHAAARNGHATTVASLLLFEAGMNKDAMHDGATPLLLATLKGHKEVVSTPELKGSVGEGPNRTNYSDRSSVRILSKFIFYFSDFRTKFRNSR